MKALKKWYENEKIFPCECLCKFKPNDEKYVVATIVKFYPNNGWYEFVSDNKNTYSIAIPISELEALQQPKSCYDCKHWFPNKASYPCNQCSMAINCLFEPKEQL